MYDRENLAAKSCKLKSRTNNIFGVARSTGSIFRIDQQRLMRNGASFDFLIPSRAALAINETRHAAINPYWRIYIDTYGSRAIND